MYNQLSCHCNEKRFKKTLWPHFMDRVQLSQAAEPLRGDSFTDLLYLSSLFYLLVIE